MEGRRWSEGLHQAVEAKEGVNIQNENQTLASITFQNYFRLYETLAGMTGTADTEAFEFQSIYGLDTVVMPTNKPMVRDVRADLVYLTQEEKYEAILVDIKDCQERGHTCTCRYYFNCSLSNLIAIFRQKKIKITYLMLNFMPRGSYCIRRWPTRHSNDCDSTWRPVVRILQSVVGWHSEVRKKLENPTG